MNWSYNAYSHCPEIERISSWVIARLFKTWRVKWDALSGSSCFWREYVLLLMLARSTERLRIMGSLRPIALLSSLVRDHQWARGPIDMAGTECTSPKRGSVNSGWVTNGELSTLTRHQHGSTLTSDRWKGQAYGWQTITAWSRWSRQQWFQ